MKERPILFIGSMVRAILDGRKTQTRRVIKGVPRWVTSFGKSCFTPISPSGVWLQVSGRGIHPDFGPAEHFFRFPYGDRGNRLWVRETWAMNCITYGWGKIPKTRPPDLSELAYRADGEWEEQFEQVDGLRPPWRPSIFMPRWASRITLEITGVRVERLQEISEGDACADGGYSPITRDCKAPKFRELWDSVNADRGFGWAANPWVWVIEFKRVVPRQEPVNQQGCSTSEGSNDRPI